MRWGGYNARAAERAKAVLAGACLFVVVTITMSVLAFLLPATRRREILMR